MLIKYTPRGPEAEDISLEAMSRRPEALYRILRLRAPIVWAPRLNMWLVTRHADVKGVLGEPRKFATGTSASLIWKAFGENMLTVDGETHARYRPPSLTGLFMPRSVKARFQASTETCISRLANSIRPLGGGDLRAVYAARVPVLVILSVFGLPARDEALFRCWYDAFEQALSNHADQEVRTQAAAVAVEEFHQYLQQKIEAVRHMPGESLLHDLVAMADQNALSDADLRRNALILFFGAISTVEALILNTLWALFQHPEEMKKAFADPDHLQDAILETLRWMSPVQSATRHAVQTCRIGEIVIPEGAMVNCMLGSANRDEQVFQDAALFIAGRQDGGKHLAFATGPHLCLGRHLALLEVHAAIRALVRACPGLELTGPTEMQGHEFRQPATLDAIWDSGRGPEQ